MICHISYHDNDIIFTFSALALENPIYRRVSRGDRFCRCIFVGVGFFLGGKAAIIQIYFLLFFDLSSITKILLVGSDLNFQHPVRTAGLSCCYLSLHEEEIDLGWSPHHRETQLSWGIWPDLTCYCFLSGQVRERRLIRPTADQGSLLQQYTTAREHGTGLIHNQIKSTYNTKKLQS